MSAIKKFFQKRKLDAKFKMAGGAHSLTENTSTNAGSSKRPQPEPGPSRGPQSGANRAAANAALSRSAAASKPEDVHWGTSAIKAQVKKELEAERAAQQLANTYSPPEEVFHEQAPVLTVAGVYFHCEMVGPERLPKQEMEEAIDKFLLSQLVEEPLLASALMIHTVIKDPEKVKVCIETLCKYLDNILKNPGQEKFTKIRVQNKAFQERVAKLKGTEEFLQAVGFVCKELPTTEGESVEDFLVLDPELSKDVEKIQSCKDALLEAEPIKPELDRNVKLFHPSNQASHMTVPREFYNITPEELKREQQRKAEAAEKLGMLRTKEMRERERLRELRRYRYTLIRIRMPSGVLIQATFKAQEKLSALKEFIRSCLVEEWIPFFLLTTTGQAIDSEDSTLAELGLVPAVVINLQFDQSVLKEMCAQLGNLSIKDNLKPELLEAISSI